MPHEQEMYQLAQNVARLEARFDGVEREIKQLRIDLKESMGTIQSTLKELALFNERLVHNANEHTHIHDRIDEREERLDEIEESLDAINKRVETHYAEHCDGCPNEKKIVDIERQLDRCDEVVRVHRFMKSKWGVLIIAVLTIDVLVDIWAHNDLLHKLYDAFTFQ